MLRLFASRQYRARGMAMSRQFRKWRRTSIATVYFSTATNDRGREQECVFATCLASGAEVGPIWGTGEDSVLRALATLTEECGCGAQFHKRERE